MVSRWGSRVDDALNNPPASIDPVEQEAERLAREMESAAIYETLAKNSQITRFAPQVKVGWTEEKRYQECAFLFTIVTNRSRRIEVERFLKIHESDIAANTGTVDQWRNYMNRRIKSLLDAVWVELRTKHGIFREGVIGSTYETGPSGNIGYTSFLTEQVVAREGIASMATNHDPKKETVDFAATQKLAQEIYEAQLDSQMREEME